MFIICFATSEKFTVILYNIYGKTTIVKVINPKFARAVLGNEKTCEITHVMETGESTSMIDFVQSFVKLSSKVRNRMNYIIKGESLS